MRIFKDTHIDFMKYRVWAFGLSGIIILAGLANLFFGKGLKPGVDFSGGTLLRIEFRDATPIGEIRAALSRMGLGASTIQELKDNPQKEYAIRTVLPPKEGEAEQQLEAHELMATRIVEALRPEEEQLDLNRGLRDLNTLDLSGLTFVLEPAVPDQAGALAQKILDYRINRGLVRSMDELKAEGVPDEAISRLQEKTFLGSLSILSRESVGPQVGKDLRTKATLACIWALIGMLVYIALRFKLAYGVAGILTLAHDVLVTLSIYSFTNREINLPVIAAVLTIVGFSINDTIVIFDRVRDNLKLMRKQSFAEILNGSINQTLSRTIITSGTVFLTVVALFLFGGEVINDFAFTMLVGIISGSYSTIYMSCPIVLYWQKLFPSKKGFRK